MSWGKRLSVVALGLAGLVYSSSAAAQTPCDRGCLNRIANQFIDSMVAHRPDALPLAHEYAATENSAPSALNMMIIWRTATATKARYFVIDPVSHQVFFETTISEGPNDTFVYGRIRVAGDRISEVELFENRSRGEGGFQYGAEGAANLPEEWTRPVSPERLPRRAELLKIGKSIFDASIDGPEASPDCVLMENGKIVAENPHVAKAVGGGDAALPSATPVGKAYVANTDGSVPIPCGSPKGRPTDPLARTDIVDEQQGVVVSMGIVQGAGEPYLATTPTQSAFVPFQILKPYADLLRQQQASGVNQAPAIRPLAATGATSQVERVYDGKLQGMQLLVNIGAPGSHSPWVAQ